jgi:hypothetical protein
MVCKLALRDEIAEVGDIADSPHTVNIKNKSTANGKGMKYCKFIEIKGDRGQGRCLAS